MASIADQVEIIISADAEQAKRVLEDMNRSLGTFRTQAEGAGGGGRALVTAADGITGAFPSASRSVDGLAGAFSILALNAAAAAHYLFQAAQDAEEERRGLARLQTVLESTGRTHEITAGQIDTMAQSLEDYANIDKQAVMDATARLATYDSIASSLFERILNSAADLSAVFGTDISSAVSDLGRVMEDPIDGLTRLRRQGIMISGEMEDQIASLVEQNRLYDAQVLILDEIDSKVEGAAEKIADVSSMQTLLTMWEKFRGEVGNTITGDNTAFGSLLEGFAEILNVGTGLLEDINNASYVTSKTVDEVMSMDTGELTDYLARLEDFIDTYSTDGLSLRSTAQALLPGGMGNQLMANTYRDSGLVEQIEAELDARQRQTEAEKRRQEAAEEADRAERQAAEDRIARIEEETEKTASLQSVYESTSKGQTEALRSQIAELERMWAEDEALFSSLSGSVVEDDEILQAVESRLGMYQTVIDSLKEELAELEAVPEVDSRSLAEQILGMNAEDFVLNIPVSFDFDGRTAAEEIEEQLSSLRSAISSLYSNRPDGEAGLEEWENSISILFGKYQELSAELDGINEKEREMEESERRISDLTAYAAGELEKLMSDEERAQAQLQEYESGLNELLQEKLITQEQYNELLEYQRDLLGASSDEMSDWDTTVSIVDNAWKSFVSSALDYTKVANDMTAMFSSLGQAWSTGEDAGEAALGAFSDFAQELGQQLSLMFVAAGLRCIIEGGWPGLAIGLALIAAGGLSGIVAGAMSGKTSAISDDVMDAMEDELEARQKLAESINSTIDTEYSLLKRQLERNLIDEEQFREEAEDLQHQRDVADARVELSESILDRINDLNNEYSDMGWLDKLFSGRDEDIEDDISSLRAYYDRVLAAGEEELRQMVQLVKDLGVSVGGVPAFAEGGSFVTSGPQLILVGDNASGRERVSITPLESPLSSASGGTTVFYLAGDVYGIEDLYGKLQSVGIKLQRRMR